MESSPFAWELRELIQERGYYHGPATRLIFVLNKRARPAKSSPQWPDSAHKAGRLIAHFAPALRLKGMEIVYQRHRWFGRAWCPTMKRRGNFPID